eukprot:augustus_masked-scaffold_1-processed-gene-29.62-mRNA-1 protein AED:1.00 eAED:1.00 QI:0/-1/0/0/-1/1/1/0/171
MSADDFECYLYFDPTSGGTLFSEYSKTPIDNALASYKPAKGVLRPYHIKKNTRQEIAKNFNASRKQDFYRGYAKFFKNASSVSSKEESATAVNYVTHGGTEVNVLVLYLTHENEIVIPAEGENVELKGMRAVAVINRDSLAELYEGVKTMDTAKFIRTAEARFAALVLTAR